MTTSPLYNSAQRFAIQWRDTERPLFEGLRSDKRSHRLDALRRATAHFIIARNFARAHDVDLGRKRLELVLDVFNDVRLRPLRSSELEPSVMRFATRLGAAYGGRTLISAASKLLWLAHRDPAIIYDSRACRIWTGCHRLPEHAPCGARRTSWRRRNAAAAPVAGRWREVAWRAEQAVNDERRRAMRTYLAYMPWERHACAPNSGPRGVS